MATRDLELPVEKRAGWLGIIAALVGIVYVTAILRAESEFAVIGMIVVGVAGTLAAAKMGWLSPRRQSLIPREREVDVLTVLAAILLTALFYNNPFVLFLISTVLIYVMACLGLNLQFGYAGMLNFAGAAMLGVGGYTAAVLGAKTSMPTLLILPLGGLSAAIIGSVLLPPMLRTRGHYSAVITIAFSLLFTTFLDAYDGLGGPQGLAVRGASVFGWSFNDNLELGTVTIGFYVKYVTLALVLVIAIVALVRRIERSWIGLSLDSIRLDETASRCFGINIVLWKIAAFTTGNFIIGLAGTLYAVMLGYIAPTNFTFGDSLILVTIILLGGLGSIWGIVVTTAIIIILPEKLQVIQEYRLLLYAILVTLVLLFRPEGLIPRSPRRYFTGWRP